MAVKDLVLHTTIQSNEHTALSKNTKQSANRSLLNCFGKNDNQKNSIRFTHQRTKKTIKHVEYNSHTQNINTIQRT